MSEPEHVLTYFAHRSCERNDTIHLLYALANKPLRIHRVVWPQFVAAREKGAYPSGQLPILTVGDAAPVSQSRAISRYAARLGGLYPAEPLDAARTDAIVDRLGDLNTTSWYVAKAGGQEKQDAALEAIFERLDRVVAELEASFRESPWLVGGTMSWADVATFAALHEVSTFASMTAPALSERFYALLGANPRLRALFAAVEALPPVKAVVQDCWTDEATGKSKTHFAPTVAPDA